MKLNKECLITGDGETLCNNQNGSLKFYINEIADQDAISKEIRQGDHLQVIFTSN